VLEDGPQNEPYPFAAPDEPRFGVMMVSGYMTARKGKTHDGPGLSAHVIDRADNCRVVATFRSEELPNHVLPIRRHEVAYERAMERCVALNALADDEGEH
jgi:hypothetical protein